MLFANALSAPFQAFFGTFLMLLNCHPEVCLPLVFVAALAIPPLDAPLLLSPQSHHGAEHAGDELPARLPHVGRGEAVHGEVLAVAQRGDGEEEARRYVLPVENATNDPNIEYSNEFHERMNDSNDFTVIH